MKASQQSASIKEGKRKKEKKSLGKVLHIMKPDLLKSATRGCCVGSGD